MATVTDIVLSMKLLIDRKAGRVLFAEASKEVVDFLFSLLALPVATVVKLVGKDAMVGCVGNLYVSVEKLDSTYVQQGATRDALLCPAVVSSADGTANHSLLRLPAKVDYRCGHSSPSFGSPFSLQQVQNVHTGGAKGFVQGIVTYTVMDDLTVSPMSSISSITLLNTFAVRDISDLQEKTVQLGYKEGVAILKASLQSKTVLTDVFLGKK